MAFSGGVQTGIEYGAVSVDHLEHTGPAEWNALAQSDTMPVLLPGATFFLEMEYAPAREMIACGLPVVLASNYNPGSCPAGKYAVYDDTCLSENEDDTRRGCQCSYAHGACAMDLSHDYGSVTVGKVANLFITKPMPSYEYFAYAFTSPLVQTVILNGKIQKL
jgi:imidazolonepropionase